MNAVNVADFRRLARRRLPRVVFDYIDGGADGEVTLRENCAAFERIEFRPRNAVANAPCSLRTTVLGQTLELPFLLAPVGSSRLFFPRGECVAAAAGGSRRNGLLPFDAFRMPARRGAPRNERSRLVSTISRSGARGGVGCDRTRPRRRIFRARRHDRHAVSRDNASATCETAPRNSAAETSWRMLPYLGQAARASALARRFFARRRPDEVSQRHLCRRPARWSYADVAAALEHSTVAWDDISWIRELWKGPIVVKGVLTAEDARRALDAGADAIIVSNHGGRQLDGVTPTIRALCPKSIEAVAAESRSSRQRRATRQRRRQSALLGRPCSSGRKSVCIRTWRRGGRRRCPRDRDSSQRHHSHAALARVPRRRRARRIVRWRRVTLYVRGRLPRDGIAIVGSRTPPAQAAEFAYQLAFRLGEPIVAGLAPGIDVAAHRGALDAGMPTVAFIGYGFGATDPPEHAELEEAIVAAGGAMATLLAPGTPISEESRIESDRLQAEHSRAVVLVSTEIDGGAMHTMRFARELGRPRFAVTPPRALRRNGPGTSRHRRGRDAAAVRSGWRLCGIALGGIGGVAGVTNPTVPKTRTLPCC